LKSDLAFCRILLLNLTTASIIYLFLESFDYFTVYDKPISSNGLLNVFNAFYNNVIFGVGD